MDDLPKPPQKAMKYTIEIVAKYTTFWRIDIKEQLRLIHLCNGSYHKIILTVLQINTSYLSMYTYIHFAGLFDYIYSESPFTNNIPHFD